MNKGLLAACLSVIPVVCAPAGAWGCDRDPFSGEADVTRVHYEKHYADVTGGGAVEFLAGEPGRFVTALTSDPYHQTDAWHGPVSWRDGVYYDKKGRGGLYFDDTEILGRPAGLKGCAAVELNAGEE